MAQCDPLLLPPDGRHHWSLPALHIGHLGKRGLDPVLVDGQWRWHYGRSSPALVAQKLQGKNTVEGACNRMAFVFMPIVSQIILVGMNCVAFQNHVIEWSRDHRCHHKWTDTDADP